MDSNRKINTKFTKNLDSKVINRQYFHRKTGLKFCLNRVETLYLAQSRTATGAVLGSRQ